MQLSQKAKITVTYSHGNIRGVRVEMVIVLEIGTAIRVHTLDETVYNLHIANTFGEDMNPLILEVWVNSRADYTL